MKLKGWVIAFSALAVLAAPFSISYGYNEYVRYRFGTALYKAVAEAQGGSLDLIAFATRVEVAGNDEACTYRATMVFRSGAADADGSIAERLKVISVPPARNPDRKDVEVVLLQAGILYAITVTDGPYNPLLDLRCF